MKRVSQACIMLLAVIAASAGAQDTVPAKPPPAMKAPADPGMRARPDGAMKAPSDPGAVVTPPTTGTEEMAKTPKTVDPAMDDATADIDRKNRQKSRDKAKEK